MGLLSDHYRPALAVYCQAWAKWVRAEEKMAAMVKIPSRGWQTLSNKAADQIIKLAAGFGMTPAEMSRISLPPKDDGQDVDKQMLG